MAATPAAQESSPLIDAKREAKSLRSTFYMMSICFGLNHAAVTTPVAYASSYLGNTVGQAANATLYGVCMLSALFLGPLAGGTLGPKWTMIFGMLAYCVYTICFAVATSSEKGSSEAWFLAIGGSLIGGLGAGTLWTGQGGFFSAICERLSDANAATLQQVTSELSSTFAIIYLGQECFWKVLFTVLQKYCGMSDLIAFLLYGGLATMSALLVVFCKDLRSKNEQARASIFAKASAAVTLWRDPKIWLISGNNIAFGFCAAYLNGYINGNWQKEALGSGDLIGFLGAIICLIATISSKIYGRISDRLGTKVPIVCLGSLCFILIGLLSFVSYPNGKGPGGWGWGIMVFYLLQGLARGVYESTNKGVFGDIFPGAQGMGAFANCMMQNTLASTIGFILGWAEMGAAEVYFLLFFSIMSVPGLMLAQKIKIQEELNNADPKQVGDAP